MMYVLKLCKYVNNDEETKVGTGKIFKFCYRGVKEKTDFVGLGRCTQLYAWANINTFRLQLTSSPPCWTTINKRILMSFIVPVIQHPNLEARSHSV